MRRYACGNICGCCDQERAIALKKPLGIAFVTLISLEAAQKIYDDHQPSYECGARSIRLIEFSQNIRHHSLLRITFLVAGIIVIKMADHCICCDLVKWM